ncbi:MAG: DNA polymerase III subunit delta [Methylococcaceae bacterium]|nr:DNA polymerase III subunit delta [Methylococcaceae bacterium]
MKLRVEQLDGALNKSLAPVYLLSGDEPLQLSEALDTVRDAARARGYINRELFYADAGFDWGSLLEACGSFSLFGEQRILDLRLSAKPDKSGAETLELYAKRLPEDAVLIVTLPKLSAADQKARWFQSLESQGVFVQVWPLQGQPLIHWLDKRMGRKKMLADRSGLAILAARVEGNLLAAAQEIEKLHILYGPVRISDDMIRKAVADSARYDVYDLAEAALQGQAKRAHRVLAGLRGEGIASAVALWALARDARLLCGVKALMEKGEGLESAFAKQKEKVWDKRKTSLASAAQRLSRDEAHRTLLLCAKADRMIKGLESGDAWEALLDVCLSLCGGAAAKAIVI